eukprot:TRINITY_DN70668_c0_g1_i1.p1 TRINITY_DN70668_c0_g1~~TRINITY_DN70668_c0_g1_i1.p1  ORF type:complete len:540 (+),score=101.81 TRINITY_DN70668_c0_g1_i1:87-1706(+)
MATASLRVQASMVLEGENRDDTAALAKQIADAVVRYPLPSHWKTIAASGGDVYYWNRATDETTWQHPLTDAAGELLEALKDCRSSGVAAANAVSSTQTRKRRLAAWADHWRECACREVERWRIVDDKADGGPSYFYRVSQGDSYFPAAQATWEDPREALLHRLRFQSETLASLLSLPVPDLLSAANVTGADSDGAGSLRHGSSRQQLWAPSRRPQDFDDEDAPVIHEVRRGIPTCTSVGSNRRTVDGRWFRVERMPADNSCGFHGVGISREEAAAALLHRRSDPKVREFVAADLCAAVQTGERHTFPEEIRNCEPLWSALDAYYAAQQTLDERRREARDLIAEEGGVEAAKRAVAASGGDAVQAVQHLFTTLRASASGTPSGPAKLRIMQRLGRAKSQAKVLGVAIDASRDAEKELRCRCAEKCDAYVRWLGEDESFWLSFVRGCGGDRGGGLLDAIAKVQRLTVRVWSEVSATGGGQASQAPSFEARSKAGSELPDLELVHEARYGGRAVDLWYQGDRSHFDRLVLTNVDDHVRFISE